MCEECTKLEERIKQYRRFLTYRFDPLSRRSESKKWSRSWNGTKRQFIKAALSSSSILGPAKTLGLEIPPNVLARADR